MEPSYMQNLTDCSLESAVLYRETEDDPLSPESIEEMVFDEHCLERLLAIESELMDFSYGTNHRSVMDVESPNFISDELGPETILETHEGRVAGKSSGLERVQEEVMQETSLTDLLLRGAEAVEARNWTLSSSIIAKLKFLLFHGENGDDRFHRLALFFTQALHYKTIDALQKPVSLQPANTMPAFQVLQELSPYVKFAHFTANQAILEATEGDQEIHIIDFDISEGSQWPPLMVDLLTRKTASASFKVTAIVNEQENAATVYQTGRRLKEFAGSINLSFEFEEMVIASEEDFSRIALGDNNALVANCMIHQLHMPSRSFAFVRTFLSGICRLSPKIVVLVEEELFNLVRIPSMSFAEFFGEALHHYTALSDSLTSSTCGGYNVGFKLLVKEFLGPRILESISKFPSEVEEKLLWRDVFSSLIRLRPIPMSTCNVSQAKFLISLFRGGYWVQHESSKLTLWWKSTPLTTASIWVPLSQSR
ncbi:hypothetical protein K2173_011970 [Erythroxylum novogranatense]|uniref:Nodulation signaling pathway 2-like protein n=1 Tax=Erythroxylum novogranatense TaxID=1862640 RepID=A0AAV8TH23_9ROSI|nr:hypothetical protein K2173_011970 [Erythroxylum novogranatense]